MIYDQEIKVSLRKLYRDLRKKISPIKKQNLDLLICEKIIHLPEYLQSDLLLVYSPYKDEINLHSLFIQAQNDGKKLAFPRCFGNELKFSVCLPNDLLPGAFGILEPTESSEYLTTFNKKTLAILPCLTATRECFRLGYGKGYYDRFLSENSVFSVAAVYSEFITTVDFSDSFDIKANIILTEKEIIRV